MKEAPSTCQEKIHGEEKVDEGFEFESISCLLIAKDSKPRQWTIQLIKWPYPFGISVNCSSRFAKYQLDYGKHVVLIWLWVSV